MCWEIQEEYSNRKRIAKPIDPYKHHRISFWNFPAGEFFRRRAMWEGV